MQPDWAPYDPDLPFDKRPMRQLIHIEGTTNHTGVNWRRQFIGIAHIDKNGPQGYREDEINQFLKEGDMDYGVVTFWAPAIFTWPPDLPKDNTP